MKREWPSKGSKMYRILEIINELSPHCIGGRVPIAEVYLKLKETNGSGTESTRTMISQLKRKGYIKTPIRGMYVLTEMSKNLLTGHSQGKSH